MFLSGHFIEKISLFYLTVVVYSNVIRINCCAFGVNFLIENVTSMKIVVKMIRRIYVEQKSSPFMVLAVHGYQVITLRLGTFQNLFTK